MTDENVTPPSWFAGLDETQRGHITNRGWDKLDAPAAAVAAYTAFREAEGRLGVPANELVRLPKAEDAAAQKAFWNKLGAPADPTGYQITATKADGTAIDAGLADSARAAAAAANMPAGMLDAFMKGLLPHFDREAQAKALAAEADLVAARNALEAEWGAETAKNKFLATKAAKDVGATPEQITALENSLGYGFAMKHFLGLAKMMGEARWVPSEGAGGSAHTAESAQAQLQAYMNDREWVRRWAAGGAQEIKQKADLIRIMAGATQ